MSSSGDRSYSPAFSFYVRDFLAGTLTFSVTEIGAYQLLLLYQWENPSGVPDDATDRARILRSSPREAARLWDRVRAKFVQGVDGGWRNVRLEHEREKQDRYRASQTANAKKGGRPPSHGKPTGYPRDTQAKPEPNPSQTLSSSSSITPLSQRAETMGPPRARHPAQQHGLQTLHRGSHRCHAWCSERICVPDFLHEKFMGALGRQGSEAALRGFYADTVASIPDAQPIDPDPLRFWPPFVAARWPPAPAVGTRTAALQRATADFLSRGES
jgi:uncharacterized protein YdaU (DUF1376 family)